jgi:hypothetical protein
MSEVLPALDDDLIDWMSRQHVFFVATAPTAGGHVNLSPKGYDSLRVLDPLRVAYLDLTGSGAETVAHVREDGRMTMMFCAFEGPPRILRLYGRGTAHVRGTERYEELAPRFPDLPGARAIVELEVERVQTACGYSVPLLAFEGERPTLQQWASRRSDEDLQAYRTAKNTTSIDGLPAFDG